MSVNQTESRLIKLDHYLNDHNFPIDKEKKLGIGMLASGVTALAVTGILLASKDHRTKSSRK
jgi:hypothetical protein